MSGAAFFVLGLAVGVIIGGLICLAHCDYEPETDRLFFKGRRR